MQTLIADAQPSTVCVALAAYSLDLALAGEQPLACIEGDSYSARPNAIRVIVGEGPSSHPLYHVRNTANNVRFSGVFLSFQATPDKHLTAYNGQSKRVSGIVWFGDRGQS